MKHYAKALDLVNQPKLIAEYEEHHKAVWPEVLDAIKHVGILDMKIFRVKNRLFMQMVTHDDYDPEAASRYLSQHPISIKWEALMDKYQQKIMGVADKEKWVAMTCCFDLALAEKTL